jgi:hypothetical protein
MKGGLRTRELSIRVFLAILVVPAETQAACEALRGTRTETYETARSSIQRTRPRCDKVARVGLWRAGCPRSAPVGRKYLHVKTVSLLVITVSKFTRPDD